MVAHGLITGMLFFLAGSVQERYHTREISRLGGLLAAGAEDGLDPRLLRDGVARPARPRRVLGRVPGDPLGVPARRAASASALFRTYMVDRRDRHRARRRLPAVDAASGSRSARRRRSSPTRTSTTCTSPSGSRGRRCSSLIVVLGIFPNLIFHVTDAAVHAHDRRTSRAIADRVLRPCSPPRPASTADVDYHALAPEIVLVGDDRRACCSSTCSSDERERGRRRAIAGIGAARPRSIPVLTLAVDGARPRRCSAARTSSTTSRSCSRASSSSPATSRAAVGRLHRRGRLLRGRVLLPAARRRCSA